MLYMNDYDMFQAWQQSQHIPVLARAISILSMIRQETDSHSDGWAHWKKPVQASAKLIELIQKADPATTQDQLKAACKPIRAFYTRLGDAAGMARPEMP